jgi:hypothetical protein
MMDNFYYTSLAVIALGIILSLFISFRVYRDSKEKDSEFGESINSFISQQAKQTNDLQLLSTEIAELRSQLQKLDHQKTDSHLLPLLTAVVERLEQTPTTSSSANKVSQASQAEQQDEHSVFNHAIRLAKENQSAEKIVAICGIEPSEAELIVRMHSQNKIT